MDCACLLLLYMDRELVWRSVILFSQSLPPTLLFCGEEYLQSSLHIFQVLLGWLGWMTLNRGGDESPGASPSLSSLSWRKTTTFSRHTFHVKNTLFSHPNLFMSLIPPPPVSVLHCYKFLHSLLLFYGTSYSVFDLLSDWSHITSPCFCVSSEGGCRKSKIWHINRVRACWNERLNRGWVDLETWQVHYCSRLCLAWHVCVPNLLVIWQSCVGAWAGSLLTVVTHAHTSYNPPLHSPFVQHTHTHRCHTSLLTPQKATSLPPQCLCICYESFVKTIRTCTCLPVLCVLTHT